MRIGVRLHDFGKDSAENLAIKAHDVGFDCVQLVVNKAIPGKSGMPTVLDEAEIAEIKTVFQKYDLKIAMLGAYFNPVHSNTDKLKAGYTNFKNFLSYEKSFEADFVGSETGSFNDEPWIYHPNNRTEAGYEQMKKVFSELISYGKSINANVALEGAFGHVCYDAKTLKRLYDDIGCDNFYFTLDLYNYLDISNYKNYLSILDESLELLGDRIRIVHLKDFIVVNNELLKVDLGEGIIDYKLVLEKLLKCCPNAYYIFEGNSAKGMQKSFDFIKNIEKELEK